MSLVTAGEQVVLSCVTLPYSSLTSTLGLRKCGGRGEQQRDQEKERGDSQLETGVPASARGVDQKKYDLFLIRVKEWMIIFNENEKCFWLRKELKVS